MRFVLSSAPGKCILFGEHAVVYGYPAIAMALSLNSTCSIEEIEENKIEIILKNYNQSFISSNLEDFLSKIPPQFNQIGYCLKIINNRFNTKFKKIRIIISSSLFPSSGLGSSASISAALIMAINEFYDLYLQKEEISKIAYEMEKIVHGTPSGIDNTICTFGNMIFFQKGKYHFIEIPNDFLILITYTNVKHNTKEAIEQLRKLKNEQPVLCDLILERIGTYTEIAELELINGNLIEIGNLMNSNQKLLASLNLSNEVINEILKISFENGAFGSKLTGAGLGGCVISVGDKTTLKNLSSVLNNKGFKSLLSRIDKEGVRIEEKQ